MNLSAHDTALYGLILPPILSVVIQSKWSARVKSTAALLGCLVATLAVNALDHKLSLDGIGQMVISMFIAYKAFWHPTGMSDAIEEDTNFQTSDISDVTDVPDTHTTLPLVLSKEIVQHLANGIKCHGFRLVPCEGGVTLEWHHKQEDEVVSEEDPAEDVPE